MVNYCLISLALTPSGILFPLPGITVSFGPDQARPVPDSDLMSLACRIAVMVVSYTVPD